MEEVGVKAVKAAPCGADLHADVDAGGAQRVGAGRHGQLVGSFGGRDRRWGGAGRQLGAPLWMAKQPWQHLERVL